MPARIEEPVYASESGTVLQAEEDPLSGKYVRLKHAYGHLSQQLVQVGDKYK